MAREAHGLRGGGVGACAPVLAAGGAQVPHLDPARLFRRPAARARAASGRTAALDGAVGDRRGPTRLRARAVLRALDDQGAEPRPEPDDLPPRPAAAAGGDRSHGVSPLPAHPVSRADTPKA